METAYAEVGFEIAGPIAVEAFTMPTEGVVVVVTRIPNIPGRDDEADTEDEIDLALESDVFSTFVFRFADLEDVIRAAHALGSYTLNTGLYRFAGAYHLFVDEESLLEDQYDTVWAILHEYGEYSTATRAVLEEYGTPIFSDRALEQIAARFPL